MPTEQITSIKDARVAEARELTAASGRARLQKCLLEGPESIRWALESGMSIEHVFYGSGYENDPLYKTLHEHNIPCYLVSEGILKKISVILITETGKQVLAQLWNIVERAEQAILAGFSENEKAQFHMYLKHIQDNCTRITKENMDK